MPARYCRGTFGYISRYNQMRSRVLLPFFGCDALFRWRKAGWIHHHPFLPRAGLRPAKSRLAARDYNQNSITFGLTNGYNVCITFHFKWEKVQITIVQTYYWLDEKKKFSWILLSSDIFCQIHSTPLANLWDLANFCRSKFIHSSAKRKMSRVWGFINKCCPFV